MEINGKEYNIENLIKDINFDMHNYYNGIILTEKENSILKQYGFDISRYTDIKSLIFDIETMLNEERDIEELEEILENLSELNYYYNVNK